MTYQPFLIADPQTGLRLDRNPWLLPQDAVTVLSNMYLYRGAFQKRNGTVILDYVPVVETTVTTINTTTDVITLVDASGLSDGQRVRIVGVVGVSGVNGVTATVTNKSGNDIQLLDSDGNAVDMTGTYMSGGTLYSFGTAPITGILKAIQNDNTFETLAFNATTVARWSETNGYFIPITGTTFTGTDSDYFRGYNWRDSAGGGDAQLFFTNGVDRIKTYTAASSTIAEPDFDIYDTGDNYVTTCKFIFSLKQQMVLLATTEKLTPAGSSQLYHARARWSKVDDATVWNQNEPGQGGYIDAPTSEHIVGAAPLGDSLIVAFSNSMWLLKYVGDPSLPFIWQRVSADHAIGLPNSMVSFDEHVVSLGYPGVFAADYQQAVRIDEAIPDYVRNLSIEDNARIDSERYQEKNQVYWTVPTLTSSDGYNNEVLVWNAQNRTFATFDLALSVLGNVRFDDDRTWEDFGELTWEDVGDQLWVDPVYQNDYPSFVGGGYDGAIYFLDRPATSDVSGSFEANLRSSSLNPWKEQGQRAYLAYVEFLVDADPQSRFEVDFYLEEETLPYRTQECYCIPEYYTYDAVTDATAANPCVVTIPKHELEAGDEVSIFNVAGMVELNGGPYDITAISGDEVTLDLDASGFTAYSSGGIALQGTIQEETCWVGARAGASGWGHSFNIRHDSDAGFKIHAIMAYFTPERRGFRR